MSVTVTSEEWHSYLESVVRNRSLMYTGQVVRKILDFKVLLGKLGIHSK